MELKENLMVTIFRRVFSGLILALLLVIFGCGTVVKKDDTPTPPECVTLMETCLSCPDENIQGACMTVVRDKLKDQCVQTLPVFKEHCAAAEPPPTPPATTTTTTAPATTTSSGPPIAEENSSMTKSAVAEAKGAPAPASDTTPKPVVVDAKKLDSKSSPVDTGPGEVKPLEPAPASVIPIEEAPSEKDIVRLHKDGGIDDIPCDVGVLWRVYKRSEDGPCGSKGCGVAYTVYVFKDGKWNRVKGDDFKGLGGTVHWGAKIFGSKKAINNREKLLEHLETLEKLTPISFSRIKGGPYDLSKKCFAEARDQSDIVTDLPSKPKG